MTKPKFKGDQAKRNPDKLPAIHRVNDCGGKFYAGYNRHKVPMFTCTRCNQSWCSGLSGSPYLQQARNSGTDNGVKEYKIKDKTPTKEYNEHIS